MPKSSDLFVALVASAISLLTFVNAVWPGEMRIKTPLVLGLVSILGDKLARAVFIALAILLMTIAVRLVLVP